MTKKNGFTLIETMVAVVIFTVVMSLVLAVFMINVKNQRVSMYRQKLITETSHIMNHMAEEMMDGSNYGYNSGEISFLNAEGGSVNYKRYYDSGNGIWRIRETQGGVSRYITSEILEVKSFFANTDKGIMSGEKITFILETETRTGEDEDDKAGIRLQTTIISR